MAVTPPPATRDGAPPRALLLTRAGLAAERAFRAFWPLWTALALTIAALLTGWRDRLPLEAAWALAVVSGLCIGGGLAWGFWRFRWPTRGEAVARLDATMPGRPLAALADAQAVGRSDEASRAVWAAHQDRMRTRAAAARAPGPDLRLASRDPYGLRYVAGILLVAALLFGGAWRVAGSDGPGPTGGIAATGPLWEGWIEPPAHTGLPQLYLADLPPGDVEIPEGSRVTVRLYGAPGELALEQSLSPEPAADEGGALGFDAVQAGRLAIEGPGGAAWDVSLIPDAPPTIAFAGEVEVSGEGEMSQPFAATDDHGVASGTATIALDLPAVTRAFGLAPEPDAREPLVLDLPMPFSGDRAAVEEALVEDLSEHPLANLPVTITLRVTDAAGQEGASAPLAMTLPGRRFFQPTARAVIEMRRDLLWASANAPRVVDLLRAVAHRPEDLFTDRTTYLRLNFTIRRLAALDPAAMADEERDEIAKALWDLAVQLEDGTLADARERLARAQERLEEAMRNGASPEEIAELMQELREATDDYMQMLADNMEPSESDTDEPSSGQQESTEVTQSEIDALMDRIQELMEEGRMAEAAELMEQLNELMENLQMAEGEGGGEGGPRRPGQQSMEDLQDSLREQQELSDEAYRDLQDQFRPGQEPGEPQPGQGQEPGQPGQQPGQPGQGQGTEPGQEPGGGQEEGEGAEGSLADRQDALRDEIARQQGELPGLTGEAAQAARDALDRAESAMDGAEEALREGDIGGAIGRQADAMDALREGMRALGEALAENDRDPATDDDPGQGQTAGRPAPTRRDPLGRQLGQGGEAGTDQALADGPDAYRRAEELLAEIRRRMAEQARPEVERDYLRRLLDRF